MEDNFLLTYLQTAAYLIILHYFAQNLQNSVPWNFKQTTKGSVPVRLCRKLWIWFSVLLSDLYLPLQSQQVSLLHSSIMLHWCILAATAWFSLFVCSHLVHLRIHAAFDPLYRSDLLEWQLIWWIPNVDQEEGQYLQ